MENGSDTRRNAERSDGVIILGILMTTTDDDLPILISADGLIYKMVEQDGYIYTGLSPLYIVMENGSGVLISENQERILVEA